MIDFDVPYWMILKRWKARKLVLNHIDLIEVAPLSANLKIYGGRMHIKRMQDLPFPPDTVLSPEQIAIVRYYCVNDLKATELLYNKLREELELRDAMSCEYQMDLRSKSDAQIAEAVIAHEVERLTGNRPTPPIIPAGTVYRYKMPPFIQFYSSYMQQFSQWIESLEYVVSETGYIIMPPVLETTEIAIGAQKYTMRIGGLHSTEKCVCHIADENIRLTDFDVASYYPFLILNQNLFPVHIGPIFTQIFGNLVQRRLAAKAAGNKVVANSLKITINGTYGKLANRYSTVYSPQHLIQVTLSGQLALLSLIEHMELAGIQVVSANTDGVMVKYEANRAEDVKRIVKDWEQLTGFELESNDYFGLFSRDVNNYIAVKKPSKEGQQIECKGKGVFAPTSLSKTPTGEICTIAVEEYLKFHTPIEQTIKASKQISQFVYIRTVKGGAVRDGEYLGKSVRWYYAKDLDGEIIYANSGNKVPRTEGARPLQELPNEFPEDVDFDWYIAEATAMLQAIGMSSEAA
jgi:hypothetical protein